MPKNLTQKSSSGGRGWEAGAAEIREVGGSGETDGGFLRERGRLSLGEGTALTGRENGSVRFTAAAKNIHSGRYECS